MSLSAHKNGARWILRTIAALVLAVAVASGAASHSGVVVLSSSGVPAYRLASEGVQNVWRSLGVEPPVVVELASDIDTTAVDRLRAATPQLVIAVGSRAASVAAGVGAPYVTTMLLEGDAPPETDRNKPVASLTLDVPARVVLNRIRQLAPRWRRLAIIRERSQRDPANEEIQAEAAALGFAADVMECSGPKELLEAVRGLRGRVNALWCLPSRSLYEPASVRELILESIRNGLPLVGFSEAFVRAGALMGFFPDYRDVGAQTAELARRYQAGQLLRRKERPRTIRTMVNDRVVRALGIELSGGSEVELVK